MTYFMDPRELIRIREQYVDLRTGFPVRYIPASGQDQIPFCDVIYEQLYQKTPLWEAVLMEIFNNDIVAIRTLQRAFGYFIMGHTSDHVTIAFHSASGDAGKDTVINLLASMTTMTLVHSLDDYSTPQNRSRLTQPISLNSLTAEKLRCLANDAKTKTLLICEPEDTIRDTAFATPGTELEWEHSVIPIAFPNHFTVWPKTMWNDRPLVDGLVAALTRYELPGILGWAIAGAQKWLQNPFRKKGLLDFECPEYQDYHNPVIRRIEYENRIGRKRDSWFSVARIKRDYESMCGGSPNAFLKDFPEIFRTFGYRYRPGTGAVEFPGQRLRYYNVAADGHGTKLRRHSYQGKIRDQHECYVFPPSYVILALRELKTLLDKLWLKNGCIRMHEAFELYQDYHSGEMDRLPMPAMRCVRNGLEKLGYKTTQA